MPRIDHALAVMFGQRRRLDVQPQVGFSLRLVRAMAMEARVGEYRSNITVELQFVAAVGRRGDATNNRDDGRVGQNKAHGWESVLEGEKHRPGRSLARSAIKVARAKLRKIHLYNSM